MCTDEDHIILLLYNAVIRGCTYVMYIHNITLNVVYYLTQMLVLYRRTLDSYTNEVFVDKQFFLIFIYTRAGRVELVVILSRYLRYTIVSLVESEKRAYGLKYCLQSFSNWSFRIIFLPLY